MLCVVAAARTGEGAAPVRAERLRTAAAGRRGERLAGESVHRRRLRPAGCAGGAIVGVGRVETRVWRGRRSRRRWALALGLAQLD